MRFSSRRIGLHLGLALLGVALYGGYALAPSLSFLPYVALVPWAILYMDPRRPKVSPVYILLVGYLCWILCYTPTFRLGWLIPSAMALLFVPAWLVFPVLARSIQRLGLPRSITLPVVWVTVEWARLLLATSHFDLFALGYSQARCAPVVQIADVTGVYGVSFLVAAVNGLLADAWFMLKDASFRPRILLRERRIVFPAMALASAFVATFGYGIYRLETTGLTPGPRLAVLQPAIPQAEDVDLLVWPEGAIRDDIDGQGAVVDEPAWLASQKHAPVLLGVQGRSDGFAERATRSAFLLDERGALCGRYDKRLLFPYVEYLPFDKLIGRVDPAIQRAYRRLVRKSCGFLATGTPGRNATLFALPFAGGTISFSASISMESSYPPLVAEASRRGARFVVNLTGADEFGRAMEEQLRRVSMLRAIENRVSYVLAGNTGISAVIDPRGRLRSTPQSLLTGTVPLQPSGPTVYAESHDAFALLCVALSLWLLARALLRGPATMTPHPLPAAATAT